MSWTFQPNIYAVQCDARCTIQVRLQRPNTILYSAGLRCEQEVVRPKSSTPDTGACKTHDDVRSFLIGQISQSVTVDAIIATVLLSTPSAFRPSGSRMNIRHACESSRRSYAVHARSWFNISKRGTMHYDAHTFAAYTHHVVFDREKLERLLEHLSLLRYLLCGIKLLP